MNLRYYFNKKINFIKNILDIFEWFEYLKLKRLKRLISIHTMKKYFINSDVFAFGTGGSVDNLKSIKVLESKNLLFVTTGPFQCFLKYGFLPNIWIVHNPDSVINAMKLIRNNKCLLDIDLSEMFILVPSNFSNSKDIEFSSNVFREFRKLINNKATFVLYKEIWRGYNPSDDCSKYLNEYPLKPLMGSTVESQFLPFLSFLGCKSIYFSGIDHLDTGHFWDRSDYYGKSIDKKLNFEDIRPKEYMKKCMAIAIEKAINLKIEICRLEKNETTLLDYKYIDFNKAYEMASERISPKDLSI